MTSSADWTQDITAKTDTWDREISHTVYCHVTNYEGTDRYCWQAVRGEYRIADIVTGREAAMAQADATMALSRDEFNAIVSADLTEAMREIERKLLAINPTMSVLPGYHSGFKAGFAHARGLIDLALDPA